MAPMPLIFLSVLAVAGFQYRRLSERLRRAEELLEHTSKCARATEATLHELLVQCLVHGASGPPAYWRELAGWLEHVETSGRTKARYEALFVNAGLCQWTYTPDGRRVAGVKLTKAGRLLLVKARSAARGSTTEPTMCAVCLSHYGPDYVGLCMCAASA